jgi:pseudaminic acid synthase
MKLGNIEVGLNYKPFIIAEMSGNHNKSLERALLIVEAAAKSGAHAIKLQTYTADTMTLNIKGKGFDIGDVNSLWKGRSLYELYQEAYTPWQWHKKIFKRCKELGIVCFSTPFDETAVDFLEKLNTPFYKIASFENTDLPLIKKIAKTGKPIIMSTGMASLSEIDEAVKTMRDNGCKDIVLLKCTSSYPADPLESNLNTIPFIREIFKCEVGLSDHTMGMGVALASIALKSTVIEKHFTLARKDGGVDSAFSMEPEEFRLLVEESKRAWQGLGEVAFKPGENEKKSLKFRRSIYLVKDLKAGDVFTKENIRRIRPGFGLQPRYYESLLGKKIASSAKAGTPLTWDIILGKRKKS